MDVTPEQIQSFERTFQHAGTCRHECACGIVYFNPHGGWTWEQGELEKLEALEKEGRARGKDYTIGVVEFEGKSYADACDCWHPRAKRIIAFIENHSYAIARYLNEEKRRIEAAAAARPTVEGV